MGEMVILGCNNEILRPILGVFHQGTYRYSWQLNGTSPKKEYLIRISDRSMEEKILLMSSDLMEDFDLEDYYGYTLITAGINQKSSITVSSIDEKDIVFCLQREILLKNYRIEPMEIVMMKDDLPCMDILSNIFYFSIKLLYSKETFV